MNKAKLLTINAVFIILVFLLSLQCGNGSKNISKKELQNRFAIEIPPYWEMVSFEVEATQNVGTKVEPVIKSRFRAIVKLNTDTYEHDGAEEGVLYISPVAKQGLQKELYGISTAKLSAGAWDVKFELQANPLRYTGKPIDSFSGKRIIVRGTAQEDSFKVAQQREQEKARRTRLAEAKRDSLAREMNREIEKSYTLEKGEFEVLNETGANRLFKLVRFKNNNDYLRIYGKKNVGPIVIGAPETIGGSRIKRSMVAAAVLRISLPKKYFLNKKFKVFQNGREILE